MLALAFLTIAAATEHTRHPAPAGQIPLTRNEIAGPVRRPHHPASARRPAPAAMVRLAPPLPAPR
jgi:hypothetical protein